MSNKSLIRIKKVDFVINYSLDMFILLIWFIPIEIERATFTEKKNEVVQNQFLLWMEEKVEKSRM